MADSRPVREGTSLHGPFVVVGVLVLLFGLPVAAWLDLRNLSEDILRRQATDISRIIDDMRSYYAIAVVGRVMSQQAAIPTHNYRTTQGGIPIPATLSIELGERISERNEAVKYRFVSDVPFVGRAPHQLDAFESAALTSLRKEPGKPVIEVSGALFGRTLRLATPVMMSKPCVDCHNSHEDSPRRNWKVGDVRGIQEITVHQPIGANIFSFKYLLAYFLLAATGGSAFIGLQRRQATTISAFNRELTEANDFLATISMKIAKYISPQIYKSIFSGQRDVTIATERKKLTIFFSDIQDFTVTTERLQPEDLTALLNEYFTEMSAIALRHGATVDKFIGDVILVFFGDPETKGVVEDARACLQMAIEMQRRLSELDARWRKRGIEHPFRARMGINTGYCNVGNFGSNDRMEYTIIGAEANLAARLQSISEPGGIVMSYETYALVNDMVRARPLPPITVKGIRREIVPYEFQGMVDELSQRPSVISERGTGLDLFLDFETMDNATVARTRRLLRQALAALELKTKSHST